MGQMAGVWTKAEGMSQGDYTYEPSEAAFLIPWMRLLAGFNPEG